MTPLNNIPFRPLVLQVIRELGGAVHPQEYREDDLVCFTIDDVPLIRALIAELSKGRFFAFLDVTDPEPPAADSPLRRLENVVVTPHIAGCIRSCGRLGEMAVEELRRFFAGEPPLYRVTRDMLAHIG